MKGKKVLNKERKPFSVEKVTLNLSKKEYMAKLDKYALEMDKIMDAGVFFHVSLSEKYGDMSALVAATSLVSVICSGALNCIENGFGEYGEDKEAFGVLYEEMEFFKSLKKEMEIRNKKIIDLAIKEFLGKEQKNDKQ